MSLSDYTAKPHSSYILHRPVLFEQVVLDEQDYDTTCNGSHGKPCIVIALYQTGLNPSCANTLIRVESKLRANWK